MKKKNETFVARIKGQLEIQDKLETQLNELELKVHEAEVEVNQHKSIKIGLKAKNDELQEKIEELEETSA